MIRPTTLARCALLVTIASFNPKTVPAQQYCGPKCLGPFCIDQRLPTGTLAQRLGPIAGDFADFLSGDKSQVQVLALDPIPAPSPLITGLRLTDSSHSQAPDEKYMTATKEDLHAWKTSEGIGLGSSEEAVRTGCGKPCGETVLSPDGQKDNAPTTRLFYKGRFKGVTQAATFEIRGGRVTAIDLQTNAYVGPDCLGPWCIPRMSLRSFMARLGAQPKHSSQSDYYCYRTQDNETFVIGRIGDEIPREIDTIFLADFPICALTTTQITADPLAWATPEGIHLDSSEDHVLRTYGKPDREGDLNPNTCCDYILKHRWTANKVPDLGEKSISYVGPELERKERSRTSLSPIASD